MDIEGSERKALEGMEDILSANNELKILTEINKDALEDNNSNYKKMLKYLEEFSFGFFIQGKNDEYERIMMDDFEKVLSDNTMMNIFCKKV